MERVVVLERATVRANFRRPNFPHVWTEHDTPCEGQVAARLAGATIAVVNKARLSRAVLEALPDLRLVAVMATGVDSVDLAACRERGIVVSNARDYATDSVPEHALMLMLALRRHLLGYRADVEAGAWSRAPNFCLLDHPIGGLAGARLGIIGSGALGRAMARIGAALGMEVEVAEHRGRADVRPGRVAFEAVLAQSDVLSLHAPLVPSTRLLIGEAELARMKPGAILINTARGGLLDERAVRDAIRAGRLAGLGVDVLTEEPPRSPGPLHEIAHLPNVIITPHCAWASDWTMQRLADQVIDNLEAFHRGTPTRVVG